MNRIRWLLLVSWSGLAPAKVSAHGAAVVTPDEVWRAWHLDPLLAIGLLLTAWVYGRGVAELWRRAGGRRGVSVRRVVAFASGLVVLAFALTSPLDALGETVFAAHMAQHLLLLLVAPPLLLAGKPIVGLLWGVPRTWRIGAAVVRRARAVELADRIRTLPVIVLLAHSAALWLWHAPAMYEWAIRSEAVHKLEHAAFFTTALLFWSLIFRAASGRSPGHGVGVLAVFAMALQGSALGTLLTFASAVWFPIHAEGTAAWGLTSLEDQQLAGLIMWIPAGLVYTVTALLLMAAWIDSLEPRFPALRSRQVSPREEVSTS